MRRRDFLAGMTAAAASAPQARAQAQTQKPNIVFILADDLGYGDLGCYGQKQIATPHIDRLAAEGLRFTDCYAGSTVCAPSRCTLMTGLHTGHARVRGNDRTPLSDSDTTVAEVLKTAGYRTGLAGKWGLGDPGTSGLPHHQGFDEAFGYLDQTYAHTYYPHSLWDNDSEQVIAGNLGLRKVWSPDLFADHAVSFIERHREQPFFLYLATIVPHANNQLGNDTGNGMEVPDDKPNSDRLWPQTEKNFAAMVTRLDNHVGRVMAQLQKYNLDEKTLVIFTSDNGPHREGGHNPDFFQSRGPLRGIKRDLYEGGVRVPSIARWPGKVAPGTTSAFPWAFWDFLPTAAELAGVRAPRNLDGISILPTLLARPQPAREYLYWEFYEGGFKQAARMGEWKGVRPKAGGPLELYNLKDDLGENTDIAAHHPDIAARLEKILAAAHVERPAPGRGGRD